MKLCQFFMTAMIAVGVSFVLTGCGDDKATYIANQTMQHIKMCNEVKKAADSCIADTKFRNDVRFEFAKIKKVHPLYCIACYFVSENGRNYQGGFHVLKREKGWEVVKVTTDWNVM